MKEYGTNTSNMELKMYEYRCKIRRVIDGDTVDIDIDLGFGVWRKEERVRLFGVDTPESRTRDKQEKVYGKNAKRFVEAFLGKNEVRLMTEKYDSKGKFGRILGDLYVDDVSLCESLIESSNAVPYFGQSKEEIEEEHLDNREKV
jgi:micrococcal nuclease